MPISALTGHQYGAQEYSEIGKVVRQGLLLAIIVGIPTMLLLRNIGAVLIFCGQDSHLSMLTQDYYQAYSWGIIPSLCCGCVGQFLVSIGRQKFFLVFTIVAAALVIVFGYIFIFGHFGMSALGVRGMGYAGAITNVLVAFVLFATLLFSNKFTQYHLFAAFKKADFAYFKKIINIGWPIAAMTAGELVLFAIGIILFGWLGESALAAQQITMQLNVMAFMIPYGIGQAATVLVSQALGAKKHDTVRDLGYAAAVLGIITAIFVILVYLLTYKYLLGIYLDFSSPLASATIKIALPLLILAGVMNIVDFPRFIMVCSLRGLRDTFIPMLIFVGLGCILSLPISYFLAFIMHFGALGIPWGYIIGYSIGFAILLRRFYKLSDVSCLTGKLY